MINVSDFEKCSSYLGSSRKLESELGVLISTDTRELNENNFFLAIEGEKFNALNFLDQVVKAKCKYVIYTKNSSNDEIIKGFTKEITFIETKDSVKFLQDITGVLSDKFQDNGGKLIAISGSNGKTTTKEMLFHLLKEVHPETVCTQKNNNNHIGVPLTLLQITNKTKYAIVELGSNHPGEIKVLCDISRPRIGITTNIGDTHLEFFENRENVFKEEGYLSKAVLNNTATDKIYFVNNDDEYLKINHGSPSSKSFGASGQDFKFNIEKDNVMVNNKNHEYVITNKFITGKHNFFNLCVAFSVAKEVDPDNTQQYLEAVETFKPTSNRSQWLTVEGSEVFLDAYNANPSSMLSAVEGFVEKVGVDANYCLILGDMYELGPKAEYYHFELSKKLKSQGFKNFIFVGQFSASYNSGCSGKESVFETTDALKKNFKNEVLDKYKYVFIKGSRSLQLESLVDIN